MLALRLTQVQHGVVSKEQGTFLKGRTMMDEVLYANECIDVYIKDDISGVMCKPVLEKAYDHVN